MEAVSFRNMSFTYAGSARRVLDNVNLGIRPSEFTVLCGKSGCGKSTLLRHLKKQLIPYGTMEGEVLYFGRPVAELPDRLSAAKIGYVRQNPDNQIVTDKVWHELAFGLESLGADNASMKRRVAEMASFFGIQTWFRKDVTDLSGGQKQLLNLASIMVLQPEILILDEPTSQLDPIAASEFIHTLHKINRDLGTAILVSEHRLEELFAMADRVIVMEDGKILIHDTPKNVAAALSGDTVAHHPMFYALPTPARIFSMTRAQGEYPLSVREGRLWLAQNLDPKKTGEEPDGQDARDDAAFGLPEDFEKKGIFKNKKKKKKVAADTCLDEFRTGQKTAVHDRDDMPMKQAAIKIDDVWFRYRREDPDVLRGVSLTVPTGEWVCLLGGNGVGKSTTMKALCGVLKPQAGRMEICGVPVEKKNFDRLFYHNLAMLPQNPQSMFTEITVEDELLEALYDIGMTDSEKVEKADGMLNLMELENLRESHPYDLSGGEQQRLALGKVLLCDPRVLLLDEPTKGMDPFFKMKLAKILRGLCDKGVTLLMVSHDIEFCAENADRCALFFDGEIVALDTPAEFFAGNRFYTTAANRMAKEWFPKAVTCREVAGLCAGAFK